MKGVAGFIQGMGILCVAVREGRYENGVTSTLSGCRNLFELVIIERIGCGINPILFSNLNCLLTVAE